MVHQFLPKLTKWDPNPDPTLLMNGALASLDTLSCGVSVLLEEDGEALVADPDWLGGGGEGELVVAARVAEYLPARAAVMLQRVLFL